MTGTRAGVGEASVERQSGGPRASRSSSAPASRLLASLAATSLVLGCGSDPVAEKLAEFDPAEAQEIRDSFERDGWGYSEESVLGILVMERECREIRSTLADLASGSRAEDVADYLDDLLVEQNRERQPDMATYFQRVVDELRSGAPGNLQEYLEINCENVE